MTLPPPPPKPSPFLTTTRLNRLMFKLNDIDRPSIPPSPPPKRKGRAYPKRTQLMPLFRTDQILWARNAGPTYQNLRRLLVRKMTTEPNSETVALLQAWYGVVCKMEKTLSRIGMLDEKLELREVADLRAEITLVQVWLGEQGGILDLPGLGLLPDTVLCYGAGADGVVRAIEREDYWPRRWNVVGAGAGGEGRG